MKNVFLKKKGREEKLKCIVFMYGKKGMSVTLYSTLQWQLYNLPYILSIWEIAFFLSKATIFHKGCRNTLLEEEQRHVL